ncbi:MAG: hypothetical protein LC113_01395 [Acidobacteria bacterium]|nr:hypothetical protein [Acidobacteriota bacterium]
MGLDFNDLQRDFKGLLEATANLLERKWPPKYQDIDCGNVVFYTRMRLVINTYASIMWLTADIPHDPRRKPLVLSASPLVRVLFEELVTLIFFFDDLPARLPWYVETGYSETARELEHAKKHHGDDDGWTDYITDLKVSLTNLEKKLNLRGSEKEGPIRKIDRWPSVGDMIKIVKKRSPDSPTVEFMSYIESWLYRTLSNDAHLSFTGLVRLGTFYAEKEIEAELGKDEAQKQLKKRFEAYRMEILWTTFTLLLSIVSEIELHFNFKLSDRIQRFWEIFAITSDLSKQFYERRYKSLLAELADATKSQP